MRNNLYERRRRTDDNPRGVAERSLREGVPIDHLEYRDSDKKVQAKIIGLQAAAHAEVVKLPGYTPESQKLKFHQVVVPDTLEPFSPQQMRAWIAKFCGENTGSRFIPEGNERKLWDSLEAYPVIARQVAYLDELGFQPEAVDANGEYFYIASCVRRIPWEF